MAQPESSGFSGCFSGIDEKPQSMAAGGEMFEHSRPAGPSKPERPALTTGDLEALVTLLKEEQVAHKKRDHFCMEIERRYRLVGMVWDIDFETGEIVVKGFREPR